MSFLNPSLNVVPVTRVNPLKSFFNKFLTEVKLGRLPILPERDTQYHRANSLTITLVGAGHPVYRHSVADTPLFDMNLKNVFKYGIMNKNNANSHIFHKSKDSS